MCVRCVRRVEHRGKSFMSKLLVGLIPREPAKLKLLKGRDLYLSTNPLPLFTNEFLWTLGKSKELEDVRFSSPKPEELYSVGLIGRRLGSRARGVAVVEDSTIPFLVPPESGQVDRSSPLCSQYRFFQASHHVFYSLFQRPGISFQSYKVVPS